VELRVLAAELAGTLEAVTLLHLDVAHRQRRPDRSHGTEATTASLGGTEQLEVDLDAVDLLHAADVGVAELLECVHERTCALETGGWIDDLVAVNIAVAALELVLRTKRKLGRALRLGCHGGIVMLGTRRRKT
jgi:hypothetical protein